MTDDTLPSEAIEAATSFYARARHELAAEMDALREKLKAAQAEHRLTLIALLDQAANARSGLQTLLETFPWLFEKPMTKQLHGIKIGFRKLPGQVEYADDEANVIARIREHLRGKVRQLIAIKETVRKDALKDLTAAELAAIGASIVDCGEEVVIKAIDTDLDRLIKGLIADEEFARDLLAEDKVI